ncbi:MAG: sulfotransferase [Bacteroidota bacterium]
MQTVLLLSDKSSGSTALQYELLRHPSIRAVEYTMHNDHETLYWVKAAVLLEQPAVDFVEGRWPIRPREARRDLEALLHQNVPGWTSPKNDRALVFDGWRALCEAYGPVFFEKSPHHLNSWAATNLLLRYALTTDHDIRVIGLARNPLAVLYSAWTRWLTPPEERQAYWLRTYRNLLAVEGLLGPERCTLVRYEDLISDPVPRLREITDWLGLPASDEVGSGLHARSARKWDDDEAFDLTLDPAVAAIASRFGYSEQDLDNPPKTGLSEAEKRRLALVRRYRIGKGQLKNRVLRPLTRS